MKSNLIELDKGKKIHSIRLKEIRLLKLEADWTVIFTCSKIQLNLIFYIGSPAGISFSLRFQTYRQYPE